MLPMTYVTSCLSLGQWFGAFVHGMGDSPECYVACPNFAIVTIEFGGVPMNGFWLALWCFHADCLLDRLAVLLLRIISASAFIGFWALILLWGDSNPQRLQLMTSIVSNVRSYCTNFHFQCFQCEKHCEVVTHSTTTESYRGMSFKFW